ncbi:acyltransferase [Micromonospora arborensis]|uniref:acyltransferase family protein n=1 Tax=Micromonospora arborensis TaxID=2116518 RepID=UPI003448AFFE
MVTSEAPVARVVVPIDPSRRYAPALDGLRAVAALLVIALHVGIYTGQVASSWLGIGTGGPLGPVLSRFTVGVPIFFVLSGLLLYRPWADAALDNRPPPSARVYLWHRALRILPAYWLVAIVALIAFASSTHGSLWPVAQTLTLTHIYSDTGIPLGITQTWSLATEVAFYAVLPLLAVVLHRLVVQPARILLAFAVLEIINLGTVVLTHVPSAGPYPKLALWLPEYLGYFAAGIALAAWSAHLARAAEPPGLAVLIGRRPWLSWGVALVAYVAVSTPLTGTTARYPTVVEALLEHVLYLVIAVTLVLPLLFRADHGPAKLLAGRIPSALGRISYGLFLWHMVVVEAWLRITGQTAGHAQFWILFPVTVVFTVAIAAASFVLVERPVRRLRGLVRA